MPCLLSYSSRVASLRSSLRLRRSKNRERLSWNCHGIVSKGVIVNMMMFKRWDDGDCSGWRVLSWNCKIYNPGGHFYVNGLEIISFELKRYQKYAAERQNCDLQVILTNWADVSISTSSIIPILTRYMPALIDWDRIKL